MKKVEFNFENLTSGAFIISTENPNFQESLSAEVSEKILETKDLKTNPDYNLNDFIDQNSIGIGEIREIIRKIGLKPYQSKRKVVIIKDADRMTPEAQNSFLKTLEDIPNNTFIILTTSNHTRLLPTILSRAKLFEIKSDAEDEGDLDAREIVGAETLARFKVVEEISKLKESKEKKERAGELIKVLLNYYRKELRADPEDIETRENIKLLQETMTAISKNVNLRLALESLMINLK
ncbi:MAG TPA: AAA family ATPase [bacterium]|nr:AAA family ATPase [bacterium]